MRRLALILLLALSGCGSRDTAPVVACKGLLFSAGVAVAVLTFNPSGLTASDAGELCEEI